MGSYSRVTVKAAIIIEQITLQYHRIRFTINYIDENKEVLSMECKLVAWTSMFSYEIASLIAWEMENIFPRLGTKTWIPIFLSDIRSMKAQAQYLWQASEMSSPPKELIKEYDFLRVVVESHINFVFREIISFLNFNSNKEFKIVNEKEMSRLCAEIINTDFNHLKSKQKSFPWLEGLMEKCFSLRKQKE